MKKINKLIALALLGGVSAAPALADEPAKLLVHSGDGEPKAISLSEISHIKFEGPHVHVTTASDEVHTFTMADLQHMSFDLNTNASEDITADLGSVKVAFNGGILSATAGDDEAIAIAVYNVQGTLVASQTFRGVAEFDLTPLAAGMYIIRVNDKTIKFIR